MSRWTDLTEGAVDDIATAVAAALVIELRRRGVAGADRAIDWDLTARVRQAIHDHHRRARQRCALTPNQPSAEDCNAHD